MARSEAALQRPSPAGQRRRGHVPRRLVKHYCRFHLSSCPGCPDHSGDPDDAETEKHRHGFIMSLSCLPLSRFSIRSPQLHREQLILQFADNFFPLKVSGENAILSELLVWMSPNGHTMAAAIDALLLSQQGLMTNDERLRIEGYRRHTAAIALINDTLQKPAAVQDNGLLGAVNALMIAGLREVEHTDNWRAHLSGMCALFNARGPPSVRTPFELAVLQNVRQVTLLSGLFRRQAILFHQPEWRDAAPSMFKGEFNELANLAMQIPTLLSQVDMVISEPFQPRPHRILELLSALADIEHACVAWSLKYLRNRDGESTVQTRRLSVIYPDLAESLGSDLDTFPFIKVFDSFADCYISMYYWVCLLSVREAILRTSNLHPDPLLLPANQEDILTANVEECADELAQAMPYLLTNYELRYHGGVLPRCGCIHYAMSWYETAGSKAKWRWCDRLGWRMGHLGDADTPSRELRTFGVRVLPGWLLVP